MNIERGDSVKFGEKWCNKRGREELINQIVKFTPQWFEEDNGLYCFQSECPGIYDEDSEESDSIYHLFGNSFENFLDCELIKGTVEDKEEYKKLVQTQNDAEAKSWIDYVSNIK